MTSLPFLSTTRACPPPPYSPDTPIHEWTFPDASKPMRVRRPAHALLPNEIENYKRAVAKLRELTRTDPNDPRGWMQQANIHCRYCCDGDPLQIHHCWLFLPWHRWYLHFYERILGSLIGDDSFALPYWNWDHPDGMYMPKIFHDGSQPSSPLYDDNQNHSHYPPAVLDYKYRRGDPVPTPDEVKQVKDQNLYQLHMLYRETLTRPSLFMGDPKKAGENAEDDKKPSGGELECIHNVVHNWTGTDKRPYIDMGIFSTAARDPIFFSHHSNVDRMWHIYRFMRGFKIEFDDKDWLDTSFLFVDENKNLVKVKVRDSLFSNKLKYTYEDAELPWIDVGVRKRLVEYNAKPGTSDLVQVSEFGSQSRPLKATIRVLATRPQRRRSRTQKEEAVEALIINGIQEHIFDPSRFDVYVTTPSKDDLVAPDLGKFTGSFVTVPHCSQKELMPKLGTTASLEDLDAEGEEKLVTKMPHHSSQEEFMLKLGITALLEDLDAEGEEKLVVSLVPRMGNVTVDGVSIDLLSTGS